MPDPKMITLNIDERAVTVPEGTLVTEAARQLGIVIPIFCSHHRLKPLGACRMCLVEKVGVGKPIPACTETVTEGMQIRTQSPMAVQARTGIMEYLLVNHPLDCPVCDEGGECDLQDTSYDHGITGSRFGEMKRAFDQVDLGPVVVLDRNRCIVCARCVRYCKDIMGDTALAIEERGYQSRISSLGGGPLECQQCGNCIEVCPVGALTSRPFRFRSRPWELKQVETVCTYCSNGCTYHLGRHGSKVVRARAKRSHGVNRDFLCARGRFGYEFISAADRLQHPKARRDGTTGRVEWSAALDAWAKAVEAAKRAGKAVAGLAGARLSNEDLYLFQKLFREVLGSPHVDHRMSARAPLSGATLRRLAAFPPAPASALETAGAVLSFGEDLCEEQPLYGTSVLRELNYRNLPLVVAHSRRVDRLKAAASTLTYRSGAELAAARGLLKAVAAHPAAAAAHREAAAKLCDAWTWESVASGSGLAREAFELAAATFFAAGPRVLLFGSRVFASAEAEALVAALSDIALLAGAALTPLWDRANTQGAMDLGVLPDLGPGYAAAPKAGWNTAEILKRAAAGEVGVLVLAGANPLSHFPDRKLAEAALRKVDFVLVLELFDTEATGAAHLTLPACSYAESDGSMTSAERRIQALRAAAPAPGEAMPDWRILERLAAAAGTAWNYADVRAVQEEIRTGVKLYSGLGRRVGPAAPCWTLEGAAAPVFAPVPEGRAVAAPAAGLLRVEAGNSIFHHGTLTRHDPVLTGLLPSPVLHVSAEDAARLGLDEGDLAQLEAPGTRLEVRVKVGGPSAPGVAFFPDHFAGAEANRILGPGAAHADLKLVPLGASVHSS
ncbi:MAG: NADH-quinone oxidoreductase subunit NuoG [Candidatus Eisenbacteria bacterium]|nr:NADH-quinone oxidoreductase subunit NuoG [Candidatus Eisenbacteria bacterium]